MLTYAFEWKILDFFDQFKCEFLNKFFQYVSEIFGIISIILILMLIFQHQTFHIYIILEKLYI